MKKICTIVILLIFSIFSFSNVEATNLTSKWDLHFENIKISEGSITAIEEPSISKNNNTEIKYSVNFTTPGEFYEFTVDIVNNGTIDAKLKESILTNLTQEQGRYLSYDVSYFNGTKVKENDLLNAGTKTTIKIRLEFKRDIMAIDLPQEQTTVSFSLNACYVQADIEEENEEDNNENENTNDDNRNPEDNDKDTPNHYSNMENENNDKKSLDKNIKTDLIKNIKTGDKIMMYVIILILSVIALIITIKKSKSQDND